MLVWRQMCLCQRTRAWRILADFPTWNLNDRCIALFRVGGCFFPEFWVQWIAASILPVCAVWAQGHVHSENGVHCFATVSRLNGWKVPLNGVQRALRYIFYHLVGVSEVLQNQQRHKEWPSQLLLYSSESYDVESACSPPVKYFAKRLLKQKRRSFMQAFNSFPFAILIWKGSWFLL